MRRPSKRIKSSLDDDDEEEEIMLEYGLHPLGIQPLGEYGARGLGFGGVWWDRLDDPVIVGILGLLTYDELCAFMVTCKAAYLFANFEELWRFLVFEKFEGRFRYCGNWKRTFVKCLVGRDVMDGCRFTGLYSDFLFHPWMCASMKIPDEWTRFENVDRRSGLTIKQFIDEYESKNLPVILTDIVPNWPAYKLWKVDYLNRVCGDMKFSCQTVDMKLCDYFIYCAQQNDERPLYLFDTDVISKGNPLEKDFESPAIFEDLFSVLGETRPDHQWIIIGPKRSGSTFHKDPNATSAWNAVITGSKKWVLYPPNQLPPGVYASPDEADVMTPVSIMEWFLNWYEAPDPHSNANVKECVVNPGEMIFIPSRWWHTVLNLQDSIAITHNFASSCNLDAVLDFLKRRPEQVSGVDPSRNLYQEFSQALEKQYPDLALAAKIREQESERKRKAIIENQQKIRQLWSRNENEDEQGLFKFEFSS